MRRVALGTVMGRINSDIANATTPEGLEKLQSTIDTNRALLHIIPADMRAREESRIKRTLTGGVEKLIAEEWAQLEGRGVGPAALKYEAEWYNNFETRYLKVFDRDTIRGDWGLSVRQFATKGSGRGSICHDGSGQGSYLS
ncbi:MAG: hypothetical protein NTAFB01_11410 [Nitrospira sp.]